MGKTTNILDLNNRLEKVEKGNVAQNSYTSLKNKPKINSVILTGNKSLADLGAAAAADLITLAGDVGDKTQLTTTDKSSTVAAINELVSGASLHDIGNDYTFADLTAEQNVTWFTNWADNINFPVPFGSGVLIPAKDPTHKAIFYIGIGSGSSGEIYTNTYKNGAWEKWNGNGLTYGSYSINNATDVKDFIKKAIQQAHSDLANKQLFTLYNVVAVYEGNDRFYGTIERQDTAGYAFSLSKANGDNIYQGYCNLATDSLTLYEFTGTLVS